MLNAVAGRGADVRGRRLEPLFVSTPKWSEALDMEAVSLVQGSQCRVSAQERCARRAARPFSLRLACV